MMNILYCLQGILEFDNYQEVERIRHSEWNVKGPTGRGVWLKIPPYSLWGRERRSLYIILSRSIRCYCYDLVYECENYHHAIRHAGTVFQSSEIDSETEGWTELKKILTVCVERDIDSWERHLSMLPEYWLNRSDGQQQIRTRIVATHAFVPFLISVGQW